MASWRLFSYANWLRDFSENEAFSTLSRRAPKFSKVIFYFFFGNLFPLFVLWLKTFLYNRRRLLLVRRLFCLVLLTIFCYYYCCYFFPVCVCVKPFGRIRLRIRLLSSLFFCFPSLYLVVLYILLFSLSWKKMAVPSCLCISFSSFSRCNTLSFGGVSPWCNNNKPSWKS